MTTRHYSAELKTNEFRSLTYHFTYRFCILSGCNTRTEIKPCIIHISPYLFIALAIIPTRGRTAAAPSPFVSARLRSSPRISTRLGAIYVRASTSLSVSVRLRTLPCVSVRLRVSAHLRTFPCVCISVPSLCRLWLHHRPAPPSCPPIAGRGESCVGRQLCVCVGGGGYKVMTYTVAIFCTWAVRTDPTAALWTCGAHDKSLRLCIAFYSGVHIDAFSRFEEPVFRC